MIELYQMKSASAIYFPQIYRNGGGRGLFMGLPSPATISDGSLSCRKGVADSSIAQISLRIPPELWVSGHPLEGHKPTRYVALFPCEDPNLMLMSVMKIGQVAMRMAKRIVDVPMGMPADTDPLDMLVIMILIVESVPVIVFHSGVPMLVRVLFKDHDAQRSGNENHSQSLKQ
jgi:hypothetical protein